MVNFLLEFLAWVNLSKNKEKTGEQHIEDALANLEKGSQILS